jgi:FtsP/CotA-like multicopper oxidase with cupredoxin domain
MMKITSLVVLLLPLVTYAAVVSYDFWVIENQADFKSPGNVGYVFNVPAKEQVGVIFINGQYPGPTIVANEGDTIRVNVTNYLYESGETSIHWHGMHQRGTPFMDGVPMVTQCGIGKLKSFIYEFTAYPPGTRLYHSHSGDQTELGMVGAMIIYPVSDPLAGQYTTDQVALISDLYPDPVGTGIFLIGRGATLVNGIRGENYTISNGAYPFPVFNITVGQCTRIRWIFGGGETHGFLVRFAGHTVKIVSVDGNDIEPVPNQSGFIFTPGERVDTIVCGTQTPGNYPIRIDPLFSPAPDHPTTYAFFHYTNQPLPTSEAGTGGGANAAWPAATAAWLYSNGWSSFQLASYKNGPPTGVADRVITIKAANAAGPYSLPPSFNWYGFSMADDRHIGEMPDTPYLHHRGLNDKCIPEHGNMFTINNASTIDIIINNYLDFPGNFSGIAHPIHLHGMDFYVLGTGKYITPDVVTNDPLQFYDTNITAREQRCGHKLDEAANCQYWDSVDRVKLNFINPPLKDTVILPSASWVYLRVVMDNPGVWFCHCHIAGHLGVGMLAVFNVMPYSQPDLPSDTTYCGLCRPDYDKVMGITRYDSCKSCCPSTTCPDKTCPSCPSSSSSCCSGANSGSNTNTVSNTVNVNFANMFNGLDLH